MSFTKTLDRLEKQIRAMKNNQTGVHIIENGYCFTCKGECKHLDNDKAIKILDDIFCVEVKNGDNGFSDCPTEVLLKIANEQEGAHGQAHKT